MSGIAGVIRFNGRSVSSSEIAKMTDAMAYRGQDGINHFLQRNVGLGHCMLHTTPESLSERQPLSNENGSITLVMDGRIDNYKELRKDLLLRGTMLRDDSDAELVLRIYERWTTETAERLDGDFAFVVWDHRLQQAYCARDRIGKKPFYYWLDSGSLVFATDFHAILALPGSPRAVNDGMIAEHLSVNIHNLDETLIEGIKRLPPATQLCISAAGLREVRYWDIDCTAEIRYKDSREYEEHFLELFRTTVGRQTRSISPVGIYLSGGIDSSAVACVAADMAVEKDALEAFSLVYPGQGCDETLFIESVLDKSGLRGNLLEAKKLPFSTFVDDIERFCDITDGPNGADTRSIRELASKRGFRVMLDGYGGDEWFGRENNYYHYLVRTLKLPTLARQFNFDLHDRSFRSALSELTYGGLLPLIPNNLRNALRSFRNSLKRTGANGKSSGFGVISSELAHRTSLRHRLCQTTSCKLSEEPNHYARHQLLQYGWNVRGQEISNRLASLHGHEERSPFNDHRMIEFAFALPEEQRGGYSGKHVIRNATRGLMPDKVRHRTDEAEFASLVAQAVRESPFDVVLENSRSISSFIDKSTTFLKFRQLCQNPGADADGHSGDDWQLWMVLLVSVWLSTIDESECV